MTSSIRKVSAVLAAFALGVGGIMATTPASHANVPKPPPPTAQSAKPVAYSAKLEGLPPVSYRQSWRVLSNKTNKAVKINSKGIFKFPKGDHTDLGFSLVGTQNGGKVALSCNMAGTTKVQSCSKLTTLYGKNSSAFIAAISRADYYPDAYIAPGRKYAFVARNFNPAQQYILRPVWYGNGQRQISTFPATNKSQVAGKATLLSLTGISRVAYTLSPAAKGQQVKILETSSRYSTPRAWAISEQQVIPYAKKDKNVKYRISVGGVFSPEYSVKGLSRTKKVTLKVGGVRASSRVASFRLEAIGGGSGSVSRDAFLPAGKYHATVKYKTGATRTATVKIPNGKVLTL